MSDLYDFKSYFRHCWLLITYTQQPRLDFWIRTPELPANERPIGKVPSSEIAMESPAWNRRDRISGLPDDVLGHILSFLPNVEAGQAAVLGRRWRHLFGHVHTIAYEELHSERPENDDWSSDYYYPDYEQKSASVALLDNISAALLCRRRCAGGHVPLRAFRFAFDEITLWDSRHVDHWLSYVLEYAVGTNGRSPSRSRSATTR